MPQVSHRLAFGLVGARQGETEAQKEAVLSHEKLARYRHRVIGKANPGPLFLSALRGLLAQPKEAAA